MHSRRLLTSRMEQAFTGGEKRVQNTRQGRHASLAGGQGNLDAVAGVDSAAAGSPRTAGLAAGSVRIAL